MFNSNSARTQFLSVRLQPAGVRGAHPHAGARRAPSAFGGWMMFRGKTMGKPWENHGKSMGKPWENHGKTMGKPWKNHGKTMEALGFTLISRFFTRQKWRILGTWLKSHAEVIFDSFPMENLWNIKTPLRTRCSNYCVGMFRKYLFLGALEANPSYGFRRNPHTIFLWG